MNKILSDSDVANLPLKEKSYKASVGGSLFLYVMPGGAKYWRMSYRHDGKQNTLSFGSFPEIPLLEAIRLRDAAKRVLKKGVDPKAEKRLAREEEQQRRQQALFQYSLSPDGALSVTVKGKQIRLNREQTHSLKAFLNSAGGEYEADQR